MSPELLETVWLLTGQVSRKTLVVVSTALKGARKNREDVEVDQKMHL